MAHYELIVIGAGPGGYEAALHAAKLGKKVAVVEKREAGGTCLNRGCIPTKAMLHSAQLYREASQFELFGLHTENTSFDWEKIHQRKKEVVTKLRGGIEQLIKANKIDFFNKSASILGKNDVQLGQGEEILHAENILIATGSVPARPFQDSTCPASSPATNCWTTRSLPGPTALQRKSSSSAAVSSAWSLPASLLRWAAR